MPAIRAAVALGCRVEPVSRWDRKHYFYHDQPAGYQLTQFYQPLARDGAVTVRGCGGSDDNNNDGASSTVVGISHVQLEQDTARTHDLPGGTTLLDFARAGRPLIEIVSRPDIGSPAAAAGFVRAVAARLRAVGAVTAGIEAGGLRADVNVSVRPPGAAAGMTGAGQRTEIKNLSSFAAVEAAVSAERNRQIEVLAGGGVVEPETRAWTIGGTETRRLRGKEAAVDYRYMPDPDLRPLVVAPGLVAALAESLPPLPDAAVDMLVADGRYGLSRADAHTLVRLDDGARLEYYFDAVDAYWELVAAAAAETTAETTTAEKRARRDEAPTQADHHPDHHYSDLSSAGRAVANTLLHQLGGLFASTRTPWDPARVPAASLATVVHLARSGALTSAAAKTLLAAIFDGDNARPVADVVAARRLAVTPLSPAAYESLARQALDDHPDAVAKVRAGQRGALGFLVGRVVRRGGAAVDPRRAGDVLRGMMGVD